MEVIERRLLKQQERFLVPKCEEKQLLTLGVKFHLANDLGSAAPLPLFTCPDSRQPDSCVSCNPFSTKYGIWTLAIFVLSTLVNDLGQWSFLFPLSTTISLRAINLHVGFAILIFCWTVAPGLARNCGQFFCSMKFGLMFQLDIVFLYHAA